MVDMPLLRRYVEERSQSAFAELVRRHISIVYFAALRQVGGDRMLAEDVTQLVFTAFAQKAALLVDRPVVTGWLYSTTRFIAAKARRTEVRRRAREQEAYVMQAISGTNEPAADWERLRPLIDDALHALEERDREAILLRFFEGQGFRAIGAALQLSEEAARKRVERSLEKMAGGLSRHGISSAGSALAAALATQVGATAPAGLAASVASSTLAAMGPGGLGGAGWLRTPRVVAGITAGAAAIALGVAAYHAWALTREQAAVATMSASVDLMRTRVSELERAIAAAARQTQAAADDNGRLRSAIETASLAGIVEKEASRIAFVIDTSGSMRDPKTRGLYSAILDRVDTELAANPELRFFQVFDGDGRHVVKNTVGKWLPNTPGARAEALAALRTYSQDSISNPVPGVERALEALDAARDPLSRLHIVILGDEFIERQDKVLARLDELNPADAKGRRRVSISAVAFPTWRALAGHRLVGETREIDARGRAVMGGIRAPAPAPAPDPPSTYRKYDRLMRAVAAMHGGTFVTSEGF